MTKDQIEWRCKNPAQSSQIRLWILAGVAVLFCRQILTIFLSFSFPGLSRTIYHTKIFETYNITFFMHIILLRTGVTFFLQTNNEY